MEGIWEDEARSCSACIRYPDSGQNQTNKYEVKIPYVTGLILTHSLDGEVKGLKNWAPEDQPVVICLSFGHFVSWLLLVC